MVICSIVIPVFGPERLLRECLESLHSHTSDYELILVDNGTGYSMSADAVIHNPVNLGFGRACNEAARIVHSDLICFLNVDVIVPPNWLQPLVSAMDNKAIAMCGPRIIHPDGSLQTASGIRTWHGGGSAGGEELKIDGPSCDADGVTGACMMIRKDVFFAAGGFDTDFLNGYEDVALCLSVREAGWRIRYVAESTIIHHESAAGGNDRWSHAAQNVMTMNRKWGSR